MKQALSVSVLPLLCCSCATTLLRVELRLRATEPPVERIHLVQPSSIASGKPKVVREDGEFTYYTWSALLHGTRRGFLVVDLLPSAGEQQTEVYDLRRCGLSRRTDWSSWRSPQSVGQPGKWGSVPFQILHNIDAASAGEDAEEKYSQFRYTLERRRP